MANSSWEASCELPEVCFDIQDGSMQAPLAHVTADAGHVASTVPKQTSVSVRLRAGFMFRSCIHKKLD